MKVAVIGSINVDLMYKLDKHLKTGETAFGKDYAVQHGGKGANQAVMVKAMHDNTVFLGALGQDAFSETAYENLKAKGLDKAILTKSESTGLAVIEVVNGDNSIVVFSGANMALTKEDVDTFFKNNDDIGVLVLQLEIPLKTVEHAAKKAHDKGWVTVLNPAPGQTLPKSLIDLVDYLVPNETETDTIFGTTDYASVVKKYDGKVLITLGSQGVLALIDGSLKQIPAKRVKVLDTTGAGDSFIAGFAVSLANQRGLEEAIKQGIHAASITIGFYGAQTAYDALKEEYSHEKTRHIK